MAGFHGKPAIFVSLRGAQRRGNLKAKGMASRNEARGTKREMMPIVGTWGTQRENACHGNHGEGYAAPICLIPGNFAVLFRSVFFIFRTEMPFRSVKDCRVGRKNAPSSQ